MIAVLFSSIILGISELFLNRLNFIVLHDLFCFSKKTSYGSANSCSNKNKQLKFDLKLFGSFLMSDSKFLRNRRLFSNSEATLSRHNRISRSCNKYKFKLRLRMEYEFSNLMQRIFQETCLTLVVSWLKKIRVDQPSSYL